MAYEFDQLTKDLNATLKKGQDKQQVEAVTCVRLIWRSTARPF